MPDLRSIKAAPTAVLLVETALRGQQKGVPIVRLATVTKVGTKFLYVRINRQGVFQGLEYKVLRETGRVQDRVGDMMTVYLNDEQYQTERVRKKREADAQEKMRGGLTGRRYWETMTDDELDTLYTLLKKLNGETP